MKKIIKLLLLGICLNSILSFTALAGWKQDSTGWWYENNDGSYAQNGRKQIDGQWYFFNQSGYCLTNTLTPDGYWVNEDGHFNEQKRIYGKCVFNPTSYVKIEDKYLITGDICDTGYMEQSVIDLLQPGDIVFTPSLSSGDRVCEFNKPELISDIFYNNGKKVLVTSYIYREEMLGLIEVNYYLSSQEMYGNTSYSMDWPVYRIIEKNVVLIADANTRYTWTDAYEHSTIEKCLEAWTGNGWPDRNKVWEIDLNGSYIEKARNIKANYVG